MRVCADHQCDTLSVCRSEKNVRSQFAFAETSKTSYLCPAPCRLSYTDFMITHLPRKTVVGHSCHCRHSGDGLYHAELMALLLECGETNWSTQF
jgi:hypothetical protein